ncbi:MAG: hypothetical protein JW990_11945 [Thermoleophilia bacterium]|nr:hypothetical protein [Thermoleophilia bacterium]
MGSRVRARVTLGSKRMRIIAGLVGVVVCTAIGLGPTGCGPGYPPTYPISDPVVAVDGQGYVFVVYQRGFPNTSTRLAPAPDAFVQKLSPAGDRLWGEIGIRLDAGEADRDSNRRPTGGGRPHAAVDEVGNVTVLWVYDGRLFGRKLDGSGNPVWDAEPLEVGYPVSLECVRDGGSIAAWIDADRSLLFQRLGADGVPLWPEGCSWIADADGFAVTSDQHGNTWVAWVDERTAAIELQVLDQSGRFAWPKAIMLQKGHQQPGQAPDPSGYSLRMAPNEYGGVLVIWSHRWEQVPLTMCSVGGDGRLLWTNTYDVTWGSGGVEAGAFVEDDRGGVFRIWRRGQSLLASHVDGAGRETWGDGGPELVRITDASASSNEFYYSAAGDGAGGIIAAWDNLEGQVTKRYAQRLDLAGKRLWPNNGVAIGLASYRPVASSGDAVFFSTADTWSGESWIQKLDMDGNVVWGENGIRLDDWRVAPGP